MLSAWTSLEITSGRKPPASIPSAVRKPNEPPPCPISKTTPRSRRDDLLENPSVAAHRRVRERTEAMGKDIAPAHPRHDLEPRRRRVVEMRHHRQPGLLGDF